MKCKDCTMDCHYRTSDGEKECEFQNHIIQLPDEWQGVRIQAAIAAMQGMLANPELLKTADWDRWKIEHKLIFQLLSKEILQVLKEI